MPYIPETSSTGGGSIKVNDINTGYLSGVTDLTQTNVKLKNYDIALEFRFGFENCPPDWQRKMSILAKFDKDKQGNVTKSPESDKEINKILRKLEMLGFTTITRQGNKIVNIDGICISECGKLVLSDDTPIEHLPELLETMGRGKRYFLYINKKGGYDNIAAYIDEAITVLSIEKKDSYAKRLQEHFDWLVNNASSFSNSKSSSVASSSESEDLVFIVAP